MCALKKKKKACENHFSFEIFVLFRSLRIVFRKFTFGSAIQLLSPIYSYLLQFFILIVVLEMLSYLLMLLLATEDFQCHRGVVEQWMGVKLLEKV